jgi:hypothetical protein
MRPANESKSERFRRLAEARVNKILAMMRLLGNLCGTGFYEYSRDEVEQIFTVLQLELIKNKMRFLQPQREKRKRFSLSEPYEIKQPEPVDKPVLAIPLPDGTYLRAVGYPQGPYAAVNIYWDNGEIPSTDPICFAEYNPEKPEKQRLCIGAYCHDSDETTYYQPYVAAERNCNE